MFQNPMETIEIILVVPQINRQFAAKISLQLCVPPFQTEDVPSSLLIITFELRRQPSSIMRMPYLHQFIKNCISDTIR